MVITVDIIALPSQKFMQRIAHYALFNKKKLFNIFFELKKFKLTNIDYKIIEQSIII